MYWGTHLKLHEKLGSEMVGSDDIERDRGIVRFRHLPHHIQKCGIGRLPDDHLELHSTKKRKACRQTNDRIEYTSLREQNPQPVGSADCVKQLTCSIPVRVQDTMM